MKGTRMNPNVRFTQNEARRVWTRWMETPLYSSAKPVLHAAYQELAELVVADPRTLTYPGLDPSLFAPNAPKDVV
jgi:hypothetical protein